MTAAHRTALLRSRALAALLVPAALVGPVAAVPAAQPRLEEKILDSKYRHGDYAVHAGWHDPWDWQFEEHGTHAVPIGVKVRLRGLGWLRVEGDLTYFRRSNEPPVLVSLYKAPEFDGLLLGGTVQLVPWQRGILRPYAGGGPVFASLGNDFLAFRPEIRDADPSNPDQFALATWSEMDIGWCTQVGVDVNLGKRWGPFVEYRHLFGELTLEEGDVTIGAFAFAPENLYTVPEDASEDGVPHSRRWDWSGPILSAGLKIRF
jgi:hypothetical protein